MGDWRGGETDVKNLLISLYRSNTNLFTDIHFLCADGQVVFAHKLILSLACQHFQDTFYGKTTPLSLDEDQQSTDEDLIKSLSKNSGVTEVIDVSDKDKRFIRRFLDFIYTGEVDTGSLEELWQLYSVAEMFGSQGLARVCLDSVVGSCTVDTVVHNLEYGMKHRKEAVVEAAWAAVDKNTVELLVHPSWINIGKELMLKLVKRDTLAATEGQLYEAVVRWVQAKVRQGEFPDVRNGMELFIPNIEFEHMGVREFLQSVVPSDTLTPEEFKEKCIQVMEGSVRRNNSQGADNRAVAARHHQLTFRFRADSFATVGCDMNPPEMSLGGVEIKVMVRPKEKMESYGKGRCDQYYEIRRSRDVELVIQTPNTQDNICIWSEHVIRSSLPAVPSLRSKLCQVYSSSNTRWCCRLARWDTLVDPRMGYLDTDGTATIRVSLDMDPCITIKLLTNDHFKENKTSKLFGDEVFMRDIKVPKNYSVRQMLEQVAEDCETLSTELVGPEATISTPTAFWVFDIDHFVPRPLPGDTTHSLFQLEDYYLLQPLSLYVESSTCRTQSPECQTPTEENLLERDHRTSNTILFIKVATANESEFEFKGSIVVNNFVSGLHLRNQIIQSLDNETDFSYDIVSSTEVIKDLNDQEQIIVESGSVILVKIVEPNTEFNNHYFQNNEEICSSADISNTEHVSPTCDEETPLTISEDLNRRVPEQSPEIIKLKTKKSSKHDEKNSKSKTAEHKSRSEKKPKRSKSKKSVDVAKEPIRGRSHSKVSRQASKQRSSRRSSKCSLSRQSSQNHLLPENRQMKKQVSFSVSDSDSKQGSPSKLKQEFGKAFKASRNNYCAEQARDISPHPSKESNSVRSYSQDLIAYREQRKSIDVSSVPPVTMLSAIPSPSRLVRPSRLNHNEKKVGGWSIADPDESRNKRYLATKRFFVNLTRPTHQHHEDLPTKKKSTQLVTPGKVPGGSSAKSKGNMKVGLKMQQGGKPSCCKSGNCTRCYNQMQQSRRGNGKPGGFG